MAFVVLYDANVLYPDALRDVLIRVGRRQRLNLRVRWTDRILDEMVANVVENNEHIDTRAMDRTRDLMCRAIPDCLITGYEGLIESLSLPDPDDRHVLAAAIRGQAQAIVTYNVRDFPAEAVASYDIEVLHPDAFLSDLVEFHPATIVEVLNDSVRGLRRPPVSLRQRLAHLRDTAQLVRTVALIEEAIA